MQPSRERFIRRLGTGVLSVALCLAAPLARAKVDVPYGEDGSPPDSDTQAKVDAFNDALDGPDEGESEQTWEVRLQAAHEALYGTGIDMNGSTSTSTSGSTTGGTSTGGVNPVSSIADMCQTTIDQWLMNPPASEAGAAVADALGNASVRADLTTELENFIHYMMRVQTAGTIVTTSRPNVSRLSCTGGASTVTASIPITLNELGFGIDSGTITLHANGSYHERLVLDDWCLNLHSYDISGFNPITLAMIKPRIDEAMSANPFCMPAFGRAYVVRH